MQSVVRFGTDAVVRTVRQEGTIDVPKRNSRTESPDFSAAPGTPDWSVSRHRWRGQRRGRGRPVAPVRRGSGARRLRSVERRTDRDQRGASSGRVVGAGGADAARRHSGAQGPGDSRQLLHLRRLHADGGGRIRPCRGNRCGGARQPGHLGEAGADSRRTTARAPAVQLCGAAAGHVAVGTTGLPDVGPETARGPSVAPRRRRTMAAPVRRAVFRTQHLCDCRCHCAAAARARAADLAHALPESLVHLRRRCARRGVHRLCAAAEHLRPRAPGAATAARLHPALRVSECDRTGRRSTSPPRGDESTAPLHHRSAGTGDRREGCRDARAYPPGAAVGRGPCAQNGHADRPRGVRGRSGRTAARRRQAGHPGAHSQQAGQAHRSRVRANEDAREDRCGDSVGNRVSLSGRADRAPSP